MIDVYGHFCPRGRLNMVRATSKGNEAKSKMKHPSNMQTPRFKNGGSDSWSNTQPLDHGDTPLLYTDCVRAHINTIAVIITLMLLLLPSIYY